MCIKNVAQQWRRTRVNRMNTASGGFKELENPMHQKYVAEDPRLNSYKTGDFLIKETRSSEQKL